MCNLQSRKQSAESIELITWVAGKHWHVHGVELPEKHQRCVVRKADLGKWWLRWSFPNQTAYLKCRPLLDIATALGRKGSCCIPIDARFAKHWEPWWWQEFRQDETAPLPSCVDSWVQGLKNGQKAFQRPSSSQCQSKRPHHTIALTTTLWC